jgi:hypothetical protein
MVTHGPFSRSRPAAPAIRLALFALAASAALCAACARAPGTGAIDADALAPLELVEELRIGSVDDPDSGFAAIHGVDVDRDGNIYVFEGQSAQLRVYDPSGRQLRTIGRRGEGPGEFEDSPVFGVVGDTIWTYDGTLRRVTLFDRRGAVLLTSRLDGVAVDLQRPGSIGYVLPRLVLDEGLFLGELILYTSRRQTGPWPVQETDTVAVPRVRFDAGGAVVDTIGWDRRPPPSTAGRREPVMVAGVRYSVPRPPPSDPLGAPVGTDRVWASRSASATGAADSFAVTRLTPSGDTVFHRHLRYGPRPWADSTLDRLAWGSARIAGMGIPIVNGVLMPRPVRDDSMDAFRAIRAALEFPDWQAPVQFLWVGRDGGIWLRREDDGGATSRWVLLDPEGRPRGRLELPNRSRLGWATGDTAWLIDTDEFDVPWLVKYRIVER